MNADLPVWFFMFLIVFVLFLGVIAWMIDSCKTMFPSTLIALDKRISHYFGGHE